MAAAARLVAAILVGLTSVLGAVAIRLLVTLAFRSLTQVENTAMEIAAGDFGQRMTDIAPATEVGRLKTAINAMLGRIDAQNCQCTTARSGEIEYCTHL